MAAGRRAGRVHSHAAPRSSHRLDYARSASGANAVGRLSKRRTSTKPRASNETRPGPHTSATCCRDDASASRYSRGAPGTAPSLRARCARLILPETGGNQIVAASRGARSDATTSGSAAVRAAQPAGRPADGRLPATPPEKWRAEGGVNAVHSAVPQSSRGLGSRAPFGDTETRVQIPSRHLADTVCGVGQHSRAAERTRTTRQLVMLDDRSPDRQTC
jgi:hypothetical protein